MAALRLLAQEQGQGQDAAACTTAVHHQQPRQQEEEQEPSLPLFDLLASAVAGEASPAVAAGHSAARAAAVASTWAAGILLCRWLLKP